MRGASRIRKLLQPILEPERAESPHDPVTSALKEICRPGTVEFRPAYTYGVLRAAQTARSLGLNKIWVAEMGVAAGGGLISLAKTADVVGRRYGLTIDAVGFDTGAGLPKPTDQSDAPFAFECGDYAMDPASLRAKLPANAQLVLGDVATTVPEFMANVESPLGFVSNDLDYYSSTMASLIPILAAGSEKLLPRVLMYFDDLIGYPYTTENGEWAAIRDLNADNPNRPIGQIYGLRWHVGSPFDRQPWPEMVFTLEVRDHPRFNDSERVSSEPLALGR